MSNVPDGLLQRAIQTLESCISPGSICTPGINRSSLVKLVDALKKVTAKPPVLKEVEFYREDEPLGSNVWVRIENHPMMPAGFAVERVTAHRIACTRCGRFTFTWAVWTPNMLDELKCEFCD